MGTFKEILEQDKQCLEIQGKGQQRFDELLGELQRLFEGLEKIKDPKDKTHAKKAGIYVLVENNKPMYVGNTRDLKNRLSGHRSRSVNRATFAVKLTRRELKMPATYKEGEGAKSLVEENEPSKANGKLFGDTFYANVERIQNMEVWFVEANETKRKSREIRYLLEFYMTLKLGLLTRGFDTS